MTTPPTKPSITKVTLVQNEFYRLTLFPGGEGEVSYPMTQAQLFNLMDQCFQHYKGSPRSALTLGHVAHLAVESGRVINADGGGNVVTYTEAGKAL